MKSFTNHTDTTLKMNQNTRNSPTRFFKLPSPNTNIPPCSVLFKIAVAYSFVSINTKTENNSNCPISCCYTWCHKNSLHRSLPTTNCNLAPLGAKLQFVYMPI